MICCETVGIDGADAAGGACDTGHIAEVDDLALEGLQATAFSSRRRAWRLCAQQSVASLSGHHPFVR
jgi:hypothetical protein